QAAAYAAPPATGTGKETPPPAQKAKAIQFPAFAEKTLQNGLRVVVVEQHEEPLVSLHLVLEAGKIFEPTDEPGLAAATAALLTQGGTASRKASDLAATVDGIGGTLGALTDPEDAYASCAVTSDQIDLGLDLLSDVILHPSFAPEELERWRTQAQSGLRVQEQTAEYLAAATFDRVIYGSHPYGQPSQGTQASLKRISRDELVAFHKAHYLPNTAILAVVGDVKPADAFAKVERAFGGWAKGDAPKAPVFSPQPPEKRRIVVIDKPDAVQTQVRVGQVGFAFTDPDFFTAQVYNAVVGGTPASRLYQEVRRKRGLSYGASSVLIHLRQPGQFRASTYTKTESTVETLDTVLAVLEGSREEVPAAELTGSKTYITGAFPLEIETPDGIAFKVMEALIYGYGRPFLESYRNRIDAVTPQEVKAFAEKRMHPDRMVVVLVGNAKVFSADLEKKYGPVEIIPATELDLGSADLRKPKAGS
ncbi:MAG TPA: pitrilysin family protein, partial [Thermoanaerobaculia bacterium]